MDRYSLEFYGSPKERVLNAVDVLKSGNGIIVIDDEERENEGDIIFAAETLTSSQIAQMIRDCSGIICLCLTEEKTTSLNLPMMVENNMSRNHTNFTVSIDAAKGVTTGVSAADRLTTVKAAIDRNASSSDIVMPGHVFPLKAKQGGVLERRGHTEAAIDFMKLSCLMPCAVLCELTNKDGSMARLPQIIDYSESNSMPVVSVEDLASYIKDSLHSFI